MEVTVEAAYQARTEWVFFLLISKCVLLPNKLGMKGDYDLHTCSCARGSTFGNSIFFLFSRLCLFCLFFFFFLQGVRGAYVGLQLDVFSCFIGDSFLNMCFFIYIHVQ